MIRIVACAILAAAAPSMAAAQYKCVAAGGGTTFQQAPCANDARSEKLSVVPSALNSPSGARAVADGTRRELAAAEWRATVDRAITGNYPIVGMTVGELVRAIGHPATINTSDYGRGLEEQRIYSGATRTLYVYTRGGIVTAIQNTAGGDSRLTARQNCPTRQDIDNEATRLTSLMMGAAERERGEERLARWRRECS